MEVKKSKMVERYDVVVIGGGVVADVGAEFRIRPQVCPCSFSASLGGSAGNNMAASSLHAQS